VIFIYFAAFAHFGVAELHVAVTRRCRAAGQAARHSVWVAAIELVSNID